MSFVNRLINLANDLDSRGLYLQSDRLDGVLKHAKSLLEDIEISGTPKGITEFINNIIPSRKDPKFQKYVKLHLSRESEYGKLEVLKDLLLLESKRDALREKMRKFNIERDPNQPSDFLNKVFEELQKRITKKIKDYGNFPK